MDMEFLPIGTIVEVNNSNIPIMISGYLTVVKSAPGKIWDYSGFVYPMGYSSDDDILSFNHDQIKRVIVYGYNDLQAMNFTSQLAASKEAIMEQIKKEES